MRPEKKSMTEEIKRRIGSSGYVLLVDYRGLTVQQLADVRGRLRGKHARLQVVANAFLSHAARELGWGENFEALLHGPIAMVTGEGDVSEVAKILKGFYQESRLPVPRGGRLGNDLLSPADVEKIASLPARLELLAWLVGTIAAPMSQVAGVMKQKLLSLHYVLKAIEQKKSGSK